MKNKIIFLLVISKKIINMYENFLKMHVLKL
jgi:hypothetical protein